MQARIRRCYLLASIVAALVAAYALGGFFGVPKLVEILAGDYAERLGRKLAIGDARFNPFTFEARIAAFRLTEADGAPLAAFEDLYVDADAARSLWHRAVVLRALHLSAPDVALIVDADGSVNLTRLVPPSPESPEPKPRQPPPKIAIGDLRIERGRIGIEDRSRPQPFKLAVTPVEFRLQDFRTQLQHENIYTFKGTATTGEELEWAGDFTVQPIGSKGRFTLRRLLSSTIVSYLQDQLPVRLASGVADLSGDYRLSLDPSLSLDLHFPTIVVQDLAVAEPAAGKGAAATPVSLAELSLHETTLSLARSEVAVQRIEIKRPRADVRREPDGSLNLARLVAPAAKSSRPAAQAPPASAETPALWRVAVGRIELGDGTIQLEDRSANPAVRLGLDGLTATLTGFTNDPAATLNLDAALDVGRTGHLRTRGDIHLQPLSARMTLDLRGYDLSTLQPYLAQRTGLTLQSGLLGVKGSLSYAQAKNAGASAIGFAGEANVSKLKLDDRSRKQDLLTWHELKLSGIDFHSAPQKLSIEHVNLLEPYARVEIAENREINVARALKAPEAPSGKARAAAGGAEHATAPSGKPMPIRVNTIRVDKGKMQFTDRSIEPNFSAAIFGLEGEISRVSSDPMTRTKIHLEGKVDEFAPVLIDGELAPAAYARDTDITMSFRNMDLIRFNPYSGRFAGYNIVKGKLTTDLHYRIRDRTLDADHHVLLDQLEFGEATGSKDAVPLPVKLAVALLKDRHGLIDLGLPVSGSLDDPAFRLGPLVWKVLVNLLTKAVTAPFSALASLFGGGDEMSYVDFAPGAAELSATEKEKVSKLAGALAERPQLKLDVPLAMAEHEDGEALALRELERRVAPQTEAPEAALEVARRNRLRALDKLHRELLGQAPEYPEPGSEPDDEAQDAARISWLESVLLPKLMPDAAALDQLAAARARVVQSAILANAEIRAERIFLTARRASSLGESGAVRMELSLQ